MSKSKLKSTQLAIVDDNNNEYIVHEFEKQGLVVKTKEQLKSAISKLSSSEGTIIVVDNIIIDENITVPENVMLKFYKGGKLTVNSGCTLTLDCAIDAGLFPIFDGNGAIDLSKAVKSVVTVDTIKELVLKTANIDGIGCNVNVLGYHEPGDGGGGYFYWDANEDKANHNGGTIIDPNIAFPTDWSNTTQQSTWFTAGTGTGCWKRVYSGAVNVKWFGAKGDNVTDDSTSFNKAILAETGDTFVCTSGSYLLDDVVDLKNKKCDFTGSKIYAGTNLSTNMFLNFGKEIKGGYFEGKTGLYIFSNTSSFYNNRVMNITFKRGTLIHTSGIVVGSVIDKVFGLEADLLLYCSYSGVSTTLTTSNIYLNYHKQFIKFDGQLFGHRMHSVILENGLGIQFDMTSAYQFVTAQDIWIESTVAGRDMDLSPQVGQQFQSVFTNNFRTIATGGANITNGSLWTQKGIAQQGSSLVLGDAVSGIVGTLSKRGITYPTDLGYADTFDFEISLPDASSVRTQVGGGFVFKVGKGSHSQPSGGVKITDGTNESTFYVSSDGLNLPTKIKTGSLKSEALKGTLTTTGVFETVFTFSSSRRIARVIATVGAADRNVLLFSGSIINSTIYSDSGTVPSNIQLNGNDIQLKATYGTYGLGYNLIIEYIEV